MFSLIEWVNTHFNAVINARATPPRGTSFVIRYRDYKAGRFTACLPWSVWDGKTIVDRLETRTEAVTRYPGAKVIEPKTEGVNQ